MPLLTRLANILLPVQSFWGTDHVEVGIVFRHCRHRRGLARFHRRGSGRGQHREVPVRAVPDLVRGIPRARFYRDEEDSRLAVLTTATRRCLNLARFERLYLNPVLRVADFAPLQQSSTRVHSEKPDSTP